MPTNDDGPPSAEPPLDLGDLALSVLIGCLLVVMVMALLARLT